MALQTVLEKHKGKTRPRSQGDDNLKETSLWIPVSNADQKRLWSGWGRGSNEGNTRCRNAGEPLVRIASDPILYDLFVVETDADGECGKKGERGEGCVGDGDPAGGERDGRKLVVWHGREERAW